MELVVRVIGTAGAAPDPRSAGYGVAAACATALLGFGVAHYAGVAKWLAHAWLLSPTTALATAWLGGGGLLVGAAAWLLDGEGTARTVTGLVLGLAGALSWVVGFVGLFWLPRRLKPRWLRAQDPAPREVPR